MPTFYGTLFTNDDDKVTVQAPRPTTLPAKPVVMVYIGHTIALSMTPAQAVQLRHELNLMDLVSCVDEDGWRRIAAASWEADRR